MQLCSVHVPSRLSLWVMTLKFYSPVAYENSILLTLRGASCEYKINEQIMWNLICASTVDYCTRRVDKTHNPCHFSTHCVHNLYVLGDIHGLVRLFVTTWKQIRYANSHFKTREVSKFATRVIDHRVLFKRFLQGNCKTCIAFRHNEANFAAFPAVSKFSVTSAPITKTMQRVISRPYPWNGNHIKPLDGTINVQQRWPDVLSLLKFSLLLCKIWILYCGPHWRQIRI